MKSYELWRKHTATNSGYIENRAKHSLEHNCPPALS